MSFPSTPRVGEASPRYYDPSPRTISGAGDESLPPPAGAGRGDFVFPARGFRPEQSYMAVGELLGLP